MSETTPWWEAAFSSDYEQVYAHRSDDLADAEVAGVLHRWAGCPCPILDACCGNGRHLAAMRRQGRRVVGFDYSLPLLRTARQRPEMGTRTGVARADLRQLPFATASLQGVCLFFTAFGYFDDDCNAAVLQDLARVLQRGGELMLDLPNVDQLRASLVPASDRRLPDGRVVQERRRLIGARVEKDVFIRDSDGEEQEYTESVRLYERDELAALAATAGLVIRDCWPSLRGPAHDDQRWVWWLGRT